VATESIRSDPRINKALSQHESAAQADVTFKSKFSKWGGLTKALVGVLSLTVVVPLGLLAAGAFKRRMHLNVAGAEGQPQRVNTKITQADWSKVLAQANQKDDAASTGSSQQGGRRDTQVRGLAMRVIKAATTAQQFKNLNLDALSTTELSRLAQIVAGGNTRALDELARVQREIQQDAVPLDVFLADRQYKADRGRISQRLQPATVEPERMRSAGPAQGAQNLLAPGLDAANVRASQRQSPALQKEKAIRALVADLLYADNPAEMSALNSQGQRNRQVLNRHIDTLVMILRDPKDALEAMPAGFGKALGPFLENPKLKAATAMLPAGPLSEAQKQDVGTALNQVPDALFEGMANTLTEQLDRLNFNQLGLNQLAEIDFSAAGEGLSNFLKEVFSRYFNEQSPLDKRAMAASWLRNCQSADPPNAQLVALLKGCGPYLLKLLQLAGDKAPSQELRDALSQLKSDLSPLDWSVKKAMLAKILRDVNADPKAPVRIESMSAIRSLGAASVGETVFAKVRYQPKSPAGAPQSEAEVVIKLLRPGIELRAARDREFFMKIANEVQRGMPETIGGIARQIDDELDLRHEADHVKLGQAYNRYSDTTVRAMRTANLAAPDRQYLVLERAKGSTVKHYLDLLKKDERMRGVDPLVVGPSLEAALSRLSAVWFEEAFFGSGLYHGDLHSGNIMFDGDDLTMIDFGNAGTLAPREKRAILNLGLSAAARYPSIFSQQFIALLSKQTRNGLNEIHDPVNFPGQTRRQLLEASIKEIIVTQVEGKPSNVAQKISEILSAAGKLNIEVPSVLANFSRSMMMLTEALDQVREINKRNVEAAIDEFNADHMEGPIDDARGELQNEVMAQTSNLIAAWPEGKLRKLSDMANGAGDKSSPQAIERQALADQLLGAEGEKVATMTDADAMEVLAQLDASGVLQPLFRNSGDGSGTDAQSKAVRTLMQRTTPGPFTRFEKAIEARDARKSLVEKARDNSGNAQLWNGAQGAAKQHFLASLWMMRGNYTTYVTGRAQAVDKPANKPGHADPANQEENERLAEAESNEQPESAESAPRHPVAPPVGIPGAGVAQAEAQVDDAAYFAGVGLELVENLDDDRPADNSSAQAGARDEIYQDYQVFQNRLTPLMSERLDDDARPMPPENQVDQGPDFAKGSDAPKINDILDRYGDMPFRDSWDDRQPLGLSSLIQAQRQQRGGLISQSSEQV
jgi:predicted unusual protein kinase regulating ubiquinone biosynthesis (AarF/ABC1/UbiB family)